MKITDLSILYKWETLKNRQCIKYKYLQTTVCVKPPFLWFNWWILNLHESDTLKNVCLCVKLCRFVIDVRWLVCLSLKCQQARAATGSSRDQLIFSVALGWGWAEGKVYTTLTGCSKVNLLQLEQLGWADRQCRWLTSQCWAGTVIPFPYPLSHSLPHPNRCVRLEAALHSVMISVWHQIWSITKA